MATTDFNSIMLAQGMTENQLQQLLAASWFDASIPFTEWKQTFVGAFASKYPDRLHVIRYIAEALQVTVPSWKNLTKVNIATVRAYLLSKMSENSAKVYLSCLSSIMSDFAEEGVLPGKNYDNSFRVKGTPSQHIALTEEEIERIHQYKPWSITESDVKTMFLIECYMGARSCDVEELTEDNIQDGYIVYVSKKTHTESRVPIHRNLLQYLNQPIHKQHSRSTYNDTIKRICRNVGITDMVKLFVAGRWVEKPKYELVGSHTARRSFCTNLARRDVPIAVIAALANHRNQQTTARYICIDTVRLDDNTLAFFR